MRAATIACLSLVACAEVEREPDPPTQGVVFTYPVDGQLDVPLGTRIVVSFAAPLGESEAAAIALVGPAGAVEVAATRVAGGATVTLEPDALEPASAYELVVGGATLVRFTTRGALPRSGPPRLVAINGGRALAETSTLQLLFSEPLDPRTVDGDAGGIELVDAAGVAVPCRLFAQGIHAALDPAASLDAGATYELRLGDRLRDLSGEPLAAMAVPFVPVDTIGRGTSPQTLRLRGDGDPVEGIARLDVGNQIELAHPLIGAARGAMSPGAVTSYLGDPAVQGGPIAFSIPRGQRLGSSALEVLLGGEIPSGLSTGDIRIEILADATGELHRNRFRPDQPPDDASPIQVDIALDLGLFASDPHGNAVLAQTVLGVQLSGVAMADDGVLALELHGAMDVDLLGVASAPANIVLDLVTDPAAVAAVDTDPPALAAQSAGGLELLFTEPIDLDRAIAGGIALLDGFGGVVPARLELAGAALLVRPLAPLTAGNAYQLELRDVADVAGNPLAPQVLPVDSVAAAPGAALSVVAASPGTACARRDDRCVGGAAGDDVYRPFTLAAGERVELAFDQDVDPRSLTLGAACGDGSVRIEHIDAEGTCLGAVAGALLPRPRGLAFVPDVPWIAGDHYRVLLRSGPDERCDPGEVCGANGRAASFDPLAGGAAGGPDLMIDFTGAPAAGASRLFAELDPTRNRAALRITGTSGIVTSASFSGTDCLEETPEHEACMYMTGSLPAELGTARSGCALPDGTTADRCVPVAVTAQQMYASSITMTAGALGIPIATATGRSLMRVREPAGGAPMEGFIVERGGVPTMIVALDLYMDAPEMALPIGEHDMHSKPLSVLLTGPVRFRPDGRIAIELSNTAEVPIDIAISAPLGLGGGVSLVVPANQMKLELLSRPRSAR